jgi:hypothetical protein
MAVLEGSRLSSITIAVSPGNIETISNGTNTTPTTEISGHSTITITHSTGNTTIKN